MAYVPGWVNESEKLYPKWVKDLEKEWVKDLEKLPFKWVTYHEKSHLQTETARIAIAAHASFVGNVS
jgi:hypothetical protein